MDWLFNVTIDDISVIYVTAHRCAGGLKNKMDLRSGSQRHSHFLWFFNMPVQAPTKTFYTVMPRNRNRLLWHAGGGLLSWECVLRVPACRKRRLNGTVSRNNRIKRLAPCRSLDGHVQEPYEMSMALGARP